MIDSLSNRQIKIVIADDHEVIRAGLRRLLSVDKSILILDEATNGLKAIELVKYHKPDIALLDILMPQMDGIEATKRIKTTCPDVLVVILTAFEDAEHLEKALAAEADGYLTKDIGTKELIAALHDVFLGERVFSKSIVNLLQSTYSYNDTSNTTAHISISKREQEILNYVALGKTSLEISQTLNISHRTVQSHRSNIMQKLRIKTAGELIRYAVINYSRPTLYND